VVLSTVLTILGGHIPAIIASKKEAVEALRTE
jgi:putative ABC transport system permease protein